MRVQPGPRLPARPPARPAQAELPGGPRPTAPGGTEPTSAGPRENRTMQGCVAREAPATHLPCRYHIARASQKMEAAIRPLGADVSSSGCAGSHAPLVWRESRRVKVRS